MSAQTYEDFLRGQVEKAQYGVVIIPSRTALDMADFIEKMRANGADINVGSMDTISRKAAIDVIFSEPLYIPGLKKRDADVVVPAIYEKIKSLPPAQPESKELSEWKADFKGYINALILPKDDYDGIMEYIDEVPPAQPELKKGKWIYNTPVTMKCDQCGLVIKDWDWHRFKYCPNCIADMRGEP